MTPEHPEVTLHTDESEIRLNDPGKVQVYTSRGHWGTLKEVMEKADRADQLERIIEEHSRRLSEELQNPRVNMKGARVAAAPAPAPEHWPPRPGEKCLCRRDRLEHQDSCLYSKASAGVSR